MFTAQYGFEFVFTHLDLPATDEISKYIWPNNRKSQLGAKNPAFSTATANSHFSGHLVK